jgi:hypothetical protein
MGKQRGGSLDVFWHLFVLVVAIAGLMYLYHSTSDKWLRIAIVAIGVLVVFVLVVERYFPGLAAMIDDTQ